MRRFGSFRLVLCVLAVVVLAGCDWSQVGFGAANTSSNPYEPTITPESVAHLTTAWSQPCVCTTGTLVAGGRVYTVDGATLATNTVRELDAATGAPGWSRALTTPRLMAVGNGLVYVITGVSVVALDAATGVTRWTIDPPVPGTGTVTVTHLILDGPTAFVEATSAISNTNPVSEVSALDPSGHIIWSTTPGGVVGGFAGVAASTQVDSTARALIVVSEISATAPPYDQFLVSQYDEAGGSVLHRVFVGPGGVRTGIEDITDVSASGGLVFFIVPGSRGEGGTFAVDPMTGALAWTGAGNRPYAVSTKVLVNAVLDRSAIGVEGLDPATGQVLWPFTGGSDGPSIAGGVVFALGNGSLEAINLATGVTEGTMTLTGDSFNGPVTPANGRIYVGSNLKLYALAPSGT